MPARAAHAVLATALAALCALYVAWFHDDRHRVAALLVFALPPLLMLAAVLARRPSARFWSGVLALLWFSHGMMSAWSHPHLAGYAWAAIVLALLVIAAASAPGLQARFGARRRKRD